MKNLIQSLCAYHEPDVFNPWSDYDEQCDIGPEAPDIRCRQLQDYLEPRLNRARILLIAEAAGYQGCRFTGIPITCERMLLDEHKQISSALILGRRGERTSRPDCTFMTSRPQQEKGMNEPTDTYVWGAIVDNGIDPQDVLLWNIFPFHPHKKSPFSNRTPSDGGRSFLCQSLAQPLPARHPRRRHWTKIGRDLRRRRHYSRNDASPS